MLHQQQPQLWVSGDDPSPNASVFKRVYPFLSGNVTVPTGVDPILGVVELPQDQPVPAAAVLMLLLRARPLSGWLAGLVGGQIGATDWRGHGRPGPLTMHADKLSFSLVP